MTTEVLPQLVGLGRDPLRLTIEYKVRLKYNMPVINNENERNKFLFLVWTELNPNSWLAKAVRDALYEDPKTFEKMALPSADTILKDNRVIEEKGFFSKPEK